MVAETDPSWRPRVAAAGVRVRAGIRRTLSLSRGVGTGATWRSLSSLPVGRLARSGPCRRPDGMGSFLREACVEMMSRGAEPDSKLLPLYAMRLDRVGFFLLLMEAFEEGPPRSLTAFRPSSPSCHVAGRWLVVGAFRARRTVGLLEGSL